MLFNIEVEREADGRWIADIPSLPGCMVYGDTEDDARRKVRVLALRVIAEQLDNKQADMMSVAFAPA